MKIHIKLLLKVTPSVSNFDWEYIVFKALEKTGRETKYNPRSHAPGTDVFANDGDIANKTAVLKPLRWNKNCTKNPKLRKLDTHVKISNFRTQCAASIKKYAGLSEIQAKVEYCNSIKYDYIGLRIEQEDQINNQLLTMAYWIESNLLKLPDYPHWERTFSTTTGRHNGYTTIDNPVVPQIQHRITFGMSHQLWHDIEREFFNSIADDPNDTRIVKLLTVETPLDKLGCDFNYDDEDDEEIKNVICA
jgi:hypothetical protein